MSNLKDFATGIVATPPSPADTGTEFTLVGDDGLKFPALPFKVTAYPDGEVPTLDNSEKILVVAVVGSTFTVVRAQGDAPARSITAGWRISNTIFSEDIIDYIAPGTGILVDNSDTRHPTVSVDGAAYVPYSGASQPLNLGIGNTLNADSVRPADPNGGTVSIQGYDSQTMDQAGGGVYIAGLNGIGTGHGGDIDVSGGLGDPAQTTGAGRGGNITFNPGPATADGAPGRVRIVDDTKAYYASLAINSLTGDRVYTFQDKSGTVAFTSDIKSNTSKIIALG